jgi:hypothetical protein
MSRLALINTETGEMLAQGSGVALFDIQEPRIRYRTDKVGPVPGHPGFEVVPVLRTQITSDELPVGTTGEFVDGKWEETIVRKPRPPRPINEQQVKGECSRRLRLLFQLSDSDNLENVIRDATQEAVELLDVIAGGGEWTPEQAARAEYLRQGRALVNAHDAASKAIRALNPIPEDYADNSRWPPLPAEPEPEEEVTP